MEYLCLVTFAKEVADAMTAEEWAVIDRDSQAYDVELQRSGHYIAARALEPPTASVTVQNRNGKISSTDGPFAETREQIAGFILVKARDMAEAAAIGAKIPLARIGSVEVRPILGNHWSEEEEVRS